MSSGSVIADGRSPVLPAGSAKKWRGGDRWGSGTSPAWLGGELAQGDLGRMGMYHVAQLGGGGLEVAAGGVQAGVPQQLLHLDDVRPGLERLGGEVCRRGSTRAPAGFCAPSPARRYNVAIVYWTAERVMASASWPTKRGAPRAAGFRRGKPSLRVVKYAARRGSSGSSMGMIRPAPSLPFTCSRRAVGPVDGGRGQAQRLAQADAGDEERGHQRQVALRPRPPGPGVGRPRSLPRSGTEPAMPASDSKRFLRPTRPSPTSPMGTTTPTLERSYRPSAFSG